MNIHTYFWTCTFLNQNWADRKENVAFFSVVGSSLHLWVFFGSLMNNRTKRNLTKLYYVSNSFRLPKMNAKNRNKFLAEKSYWRNLFSKAVRPHLCMIRRRKERAREG